MPLKFKIAIIAFFSALVIAGSAILIAVVVDKNAKSIPDNSRAKTAVGLTCDSNDL